jgi:hypothetical protein
LKLACKSRLKGTESQNKATKKKFTRASDRCKKLAGKSHLGAPTIFRLVEAAVKKKMMILTAKPSAHPNWAVKKV